jgi:hypothetical protein
MVFGKEDSLQWPCWRSLDSLRCVSTHGTEVSTMAPVIRGGQGGLLDHLEMLRTQSYIRISLITLFFSFIYLF